MPGCPVCGSSLVRLQIRADGNRGACNLCGSTWREKGSSKWEVRRGLLATHARTSHRIA